MSETASDLRVIVADDSVVIRQGVVRILERRRHDRRRRGQDGRRVARDGRRESAGSGRRRHPDAPGGNAGLVAALDIRARYARYVRVLVLSQYLEPEYALRLLDGGSGGVGYLLKDRLGEPNELADAARRVASGGSAIDPSVVDELVRARRDRRPA